MNVNRSARVNDDLPQWKRIFQWKRIGGESGVGSSMPNRSLRCHDQSPYESVTKSQSKSQSKSQFESQFKSLFGRLASETETIGQAGNRSRTNIQPIFCNWYKLCRLILASRPAQSRLGTTAAPSKAPERWNLEAWEGHTPCHFPVENDPPHPDQRDCLAAWRSIRLPDLGYAVRKF